MKTYFYTRYALTDGIIEKRGEPFGLLPDGAHTPRINFVDDKWGWMGRLGSDTFENRADAVKRAELMRKRKVASLRKALAKLEALRFEPVEVRPVRDDEVLQYVNHMSGA